ncbi:putative reverse transcriptase domain-containing protein [Tanacetum coccineum]
MVTNLPPSTLGWKGLGNKSLDLLAPQPLQLMLKTRLLTLRRYSRFWDVLMNLRLGWQVTSLKEMLSIGGRLLNKPKEVRHIWPPCHGRISVTSSFCSTFPGQSNKSMRGSTNTILREMKTNCELIRRFYLVGFVARTFEFSREPSRVATVNQKFTNITESAYNRFSGSLRSGKDTLNYAPFLQVTLWETSSGQDLRGMGITRLPAAKGQVFSLTKDQAANSLGTVSGTLFLNGRAVLSYLIRVQHILCLVIIDHEYQNCPLRFDDKICSANLFPLDMSDFDISLGMNWLTVHRTPIVYHTNRVIFGDLNNPEFIYLFLFRFQFREQNFLFRGEEL